MTPDEFMIYCRENIDSSVEVLFEKFKDHELRPPIVEVILERGVQLGLEFHAKATREAMTGVATLDHKQN